jgi:hypothetical protein
MAPLCQTKVADPLWENSSLKTKGQGMYHLVHEQLVTMEEKASLPVIQGKTWSRDLS